MDVLLETKRSLREDLQAKRKEAQQFADQIEALEAKVAEAQTGCKRRIGCCSRSKMLRQIVTGYRRRRN